MSSDAPFDTREFRRGLGCFPTGVTVICTRERNGTPRGFTANSFTSVSPDPPLISICIDHRAASLEVFRRCRSFAVNVLSEQQRAVSDLFATKQADKFQRIGWRAVPHYRRPVMSMTRFSNGKSDRRDTAEQRNGYFRADSRAGRPVVPRHALHACISGACVCAFGLLHEQMFSPCNSNARRLRSNRCRLLRPLGHRARRRH